MMLEVCNDLFINDIFFDIFCYIIIILSLIIIICLVLNINNNSFVSIYKIFSFIMSIIILIALGFVFVSDSNFVPQKGCYCEIKPAHQKKKANSAIPSITMNKVIVVGDSRMEFIVNNRNNLKIPTDFSFIAKSGATIYWFKEEAYQKIIKTLDNYNKNYKYHVVINMGVNDISTVNNIEKRVSEYYDLYKTLALKYRNIDFYLLSVNPVQARYMYNMNMAEVKNNKIIHFNSEINKLMEKDKLINMHSCDSFNNLHFETYDGLHYDLNTDQLILNYIANKCVRYNSEKLAQ